MSKLKPRPPGARSALLNNLEGIGRIPTQEGYIRSFDGTELFYRVEGTGHPVVFCYGLMCSSLHWTYQIDHFRHEYMTICMDYRGHQNSETPRDLATLNPAVFATDLAILLDELRIDRAIIVGHSMGGNVALEFYRQFPDRTEGLVLANTVARAPLETLLYGNFNQRILALLTNLFETAPGMIRKFWSLQKRSHLAKLFVTMAGFNPFLSSPEDVEVYFREVLDADPEIFLKLLAAYDRFDATSWLHRINVPTYILAGKIDHITPVANQKLLHQLIPGSHLEVIPNGSHCIQLDLPELINRRLGRFLTEIQRRGSV